LGMGAVGSVSRLLLKKRGRRCGAGGVWGPNRVAGVGVERAGRAGAAGAREVVMDRPETDRQVVADPGVGERVGRHLEDVHPASAVGLERSGSRKPSACVWRGSR